MEKMIELEVLNITNSQVQAGAFALLLGEVDGYRHLPIIIGPAEAQATALYLKGVKPPRPLTHDLFIASLKEMGVELIKVLIYKAEEGVFYSYIFIKKEDDISRVDARTSDAIALAVRANCPIYILESILEQECIHIPKEEEEDSEEKEIHKEKQEAPIDEREQFSNVKTMSLQKMLAQAIEDEDYERAAIIRDQIKSMKQK